MFRFSLDLRAIRAIASAFLATVLVPAMAQTTPDAVNAPGVSSPNPNAASGTFTCPWPAAGATCTFSPSSITPAGTSSTSAMPVAATAPIQTEWPWESSEMLACMIFAFCYRRRTCIQWLCLAFALAIGSIALTGCGSTSKRAQPVASAVDATAASGSAQHTTTATVQGGSSSTAAATSSAF